MKRLITTIVIGMCFPAAGWAGDGNTLTIVSNTLTDVSKAFSVGSHIPQSTAITDLVTKSSSSAIQSNLSSIAGSLAVAASVDELFRAPKSAALSKGYKLRTFELDPRFQANAAKAAKLINLDELSAFSPTQGLIIDYSVGPKQKCDPMRSPVCVDERAENSRSHLATYEQDQSNGRIYAGTPIRPDADAFPDSIALVGHNKICSGALVSPDTVITAGHCLCDGVDDEALIGTSVLSPTKRIKVLKDKSESFRKCDQVGKDLSIGDVALVKLQEPVNVSRKDISDIGEIRKAASIRAVGFGRTKDSIGFKYQVNIIISSWQCDGSLNGIPDHQVYLCQPSYELVAAGLNRDTCSGDSGGAVYVYGDDSKPYIAGITSRAVTPTDVCGTGGIYVLLSASPLREWLASKGIKIKAN